MFIELTAYDDEEWVLTLVRADDIVLISEPNQAVAEDFSMGGPVCCWEEKADLAKVLLSNGREILVTQSVKEVFSRVMALEKSSVGYSVTMEGNGFSTTTMVPSK